MGCTAPLTSKRCILYIYSTNICNEYFKHALYSPVFSLQNAVCFIMLTCLVPVLFTFNIQNVLKLKNNNSGAKGSTNIIHKFLFYNKFIICLYIFRALYAHHQEVKIVLYSIWYRHSCRWPSGAHVGRGLSQPVHGMATYRCDDTRCCIIKFRPPDDEHILLKRCRGI